MRRPIRISIALLAITLALGAATPAFAAKGTFASTQAVVSGTVRSVAGPAIPNATVVVSVADKAGAAYVPVASLPTDGLGFWTYSGKAGFYRFYISAPNAASTSAQLDMINKGVYQLDSDLESYGTIAGHVYYGATAVPMTAYVSFYRQNADGTWPTPGYTFDVQTAADGSYVSAPLPTGTYKVRFFGMHTGSQFWPFSTTLATAEPIVISAPGDAFVNIDGWFNKP